jgi:hypothetical protein
MQVGSYLRQQADGHEFRSDEGECAERQCEYTAQAAGPLTVAPQYAFAWYPAKPLYGCVCLVWLTGPVYPP